MRRDKLNLCLSTILRDPVVASEVFNHRLLEGGTASAARAIAEASLRTLAAW